jgi:hypothetical protein
MPLQSTSGAASYDAFGGGAAAVPNYIEEVFSTHLYTGNVTPLNITNGIDLAGKGGLIWTRERNNAANHLLIDSQRGLANGFLESNTTDAADTSRVSESISSFNTDGYTLHAPDTLWDRASYNYVSWTFRKQPKFFDIVTYTGTGSNRTIAHSLNSVPGCIIVKRTDTTANWAVYHRGLANTEYLVLNSDAGAATGATWWNSTTPTSAVFSVGTDASVNASGGTYVAYIFAHDAGGFGLAGTDNVISCGTYTTDGSGNATVTLGYEPQFLLRKRNVAGSTPWFIADAARGWTTSGVAGTQILQPNDSSAESVGNNIACSPSATGMTIANDGASRTYIYIAIRRGPMKVPTSGTSVFAPVFRKGTSTVVQVPSGFVTDLGITQSTQNGFSTGGAVFYDRLRGRTLFLSPSGNSAEDTYTTLVEGFDTQSGVIMAADTSRAWTNFLGSPPNDNYEFYANWFFKRAPGFFDEVCYTGTGSARTVAHNLAAVPEMMIVKRRDSIGVWRVYHQSLGATKNIRLNDTATPETDSVIWNDTAPTSSVFTVGTNANVNASSGTYVAYLFATLAGVSKVGSYTGTGTTLQINCGFTGGARFVMIKRTDSTGNWFVWDTARGIIAGNDPYLVLNTTDAQVTNTDYVDTYSAGFEISSTAPAAINANGGTYIFLAIA